jgi:hypothetical protein
MRTSNNICKGTFLRNGGNRYFMVTDINEQSISFEEYNGNGPTGKTTSMGTTTFNALFKNKNYTVVKFYFSRIEKRWKEKRDIIVDRMIGANRYLVKQF